MLNSTKVHHKIIITGSAGTGKTTLLNYFKQQGYKTLSCDQIVQDLYQKNQLGYKVIKRTWGNQFLDSNGVNKQLLWNGLNQKKITIQALNHLIHPLIKQILLTSDFDVCECPIIGSDDVFNNVIPVQFKVIKLETNLQIALKRIVQSKKITGSQAQQLINWFEDKIKPNYIFNTDKGIDSNLFQQILDLIKTTTL